MNQQQPMATVVPMPNQQVNTSSPNPKYRNSLKWLARIEIGLSVFVLFGGIVELDMKQSGCSSYNCQRTYGQGVWGAVFPIVAGALGIVCSRKNVVTKKKFGLLTGFSIVGAISMGIVLTFELALFYWRPSSFRTLQIMLAGVATLNMILLIVSASFGCYYGRCGQGEGRQQQVIYVTSNPTGGAPIQIAPTGMAMNPQMMVATPQPVAFAPQQNQMMFNQQQMFAVPQQQLQQQQLFQR